MGLFVVTHFDEVALYGDCFLTLGIIIMGLCEMGELCCHVRPEKQKKACILKQPHLLFSLTLGHPA